MSNNPMVVLILPLSDLQAITENSLYVLERYSNKGDIGQVKAWTKLVGNLQKAFKAFHEAKHG
jgi:hypothetical protein